MTMVLRAKPLSDVVRGIIKRDNGCWLDASDISTMYQDAAGTIQVTAMEQPVGLWKDKSGMGNHATQSITASRPVVSARKNLLLATDTLSTQSVTTVAAQYTLSFTGTGTVTLSGTSTAGPLVGTGANNRVSLTFTPTAGTLTLTVSGDVRMGQLEYGPVATRYQKVNTATDYDTDGFARYLKFDGVDDYMSLPYMGLYANGSASVVMGLSNTVSSAEKAVVSETISNNTTALYIPAKMPPGESTLAVKVRNNANVIVVDSVISSIPTPMAAILSSIDSGSKFDAYVDSIKTGTVNYTRAGVLSVINTTIGAANFKGIGTFSFLKNNLYGLIITKSAISDGDRRKCEVYLGRKAGVQL